MKTIEKTVHAKDADAVTAIKEDGSDRVFSESAENLGKALASLYRSYTLYPDTHPVIRETRNRLLGLLDVLFAETDRVTVGFVGKDLIILGRYLHRVEGSVPGLNGLFLGQGIEKIRFSPGVTGEELGRFFSAFSAKKEGVTEEQRRIPGRSEKWPHIRTGRFHSGSEALDLKTGQLLQGLDEAGFVKDFLESCRELTSQIRCNNLIEFNLAREIVENILNGVILEDQVIPLIAGIKQNDEYTFTHILNVSTLALAMGRILGFTEPQLRELGLAAMLHDTGKILIPKEILQKKGDLSDEEFNIVQRHPVNGAGMLIQIREIPDVVPIVAFEHHIHYDGRGGYPVLHRDRPPHLCSRITTVADIFDALRTVRAYREEVPKEETLQKMSAMKVDPLLFNLFARIANLYSVGEYVRLDSGEIGIIHAISPDNAFRPKVRILYDKDGNRVQGDRVVSLTSFDRQRKRFVYSISAMIPEEEIAELA